MSFELLRARIEAADRRREEQVAEALKQINAERQEVATQHLMQALDEAFGGVRVIRGRLCVQLDTHVAGAVRLLIQSPGGGHYDSGGALTGGAEINSQGGIYYTHYCDVGLKCGNPNRASAHPTIDEVIGCIARSLGDQLVEETVPIRVFRLLPEEQARIAAALRAADDEQLAQRFDPLEDVADAGRTRIFASPRNTDAS